MAKGQGARGTGVALAAQVLDSWQMQDEGDNSQAKGCVDVVTCRKIAQRSALLQSRGQLHFAGKAGGRTVHGRFHGELTGRDAPASSGLGRESRCESQFRRVLARPALRRWQQYWLSESSLLQ